MDSKKHPHANLEDKRSLFFMTGLSLVLFISIVVIQWTTSSSLAGAVAEEQPGENTTIEVPLTYRSLPDVPERKSPNKRNKKHIEDLVKKVVLDLPEKGGEEPEEKPEPLRRIERGEFDEVAPETIPHFILEKPAVPYPCVNAGDKQAQIDCLNDWIKSFIRENANPPVIMGRPLQGRTYVSFIIDEEGRVIEVKSGGGEHKEIDREVERVMRNLPEFRPASQMGRSVRMSMTVPVVFR